MILALIAARRSRSNTFLLALAALILAAGSGCGMRSERVQPRLVLLYATCSVNRDMLAPYDPAVGDTPNLAGFAREGLVFAEHHCETGISSPDFAAILSGTQVDRHKVYWHPKTAPRALTLLGESFARAGYETYFWSGHPMASAKRGYGQGIEPEHCIVTDTSADAIGEEGLDREQITANDARFDQLLQSLSDDPERRAYVQVFFTITHSPYYMNYDARVLDDYVARHGAELGVDRAEVDRWLALYEEHRFGLQWNFPETAERIGLRPEDVEKLAKVLELSYRCSIAELDRWFGLTLEKIRAKGLEDEALVVFTSDHGEALYRDNMLFHWTHGHELAPEFLRVPLIIRGPGVPAGVYAESTRSIDLHPTLLGLTGVGAPDAAFAGVDLSAAVRGAEKPPSLRVFCHTTLVSGRQFQKLPGLTLREAYYPSVDPRWIWVLIREGDLAFKLRPDAEGVWRFEAFDWVKDPGERTDVFDPTDPAHEAIAQELDDYKARLVAGFPREGDDQASEEETLEALRSLGYVR